MCIGIFDHDVGKSLLESFIMDVMASFICNSVGIHWFYIEKECKQCTYLYKWNETVLYLGIAVPYTIQMCLLSFLDFLKFIPVK